MSLMKKITIIIFLILTCAQQLSAQIVGIVKSEDIRASSKLFEKYKQMHQDLYGLHIERQEFIIDSLQVIINKDQGNDQTRAYIEEAKGNISFLNEAMTKPIEEQPELGASAGYFNDVEIYLNQIVTEQYLDFIISSHVELSNSMVIYSKASMDLTLPVLKKMNGEKISQLEVSEGFNIAFLDYAKVDFKKPEDTGSDEILLTKAAENSNENKPLDEEIQSLSITISDGNGTPEMEAKLKELRNEQELREKEYYKLRDEQLEANEKMYNAKVERARIAHMAKLEPAIKAIIDQYQIDLILNTTDFREIETGVIFDSYGKAIIGPKYPDKSKRVLKGLEQNDITNLVLDKMNGIINDKQLIITSKRIGKVDIDAIANALVPSDKEFNFKLDSLINATQAIYDKLEAQENYGALLEVQLTYNERIQNLGKDIQYRIYQDIQREAINYANERNYDILLDLSHNAKDGMFSRMDYFMFHPDNDFTQHMYGIMAEKQN